MRRLPFEDAKRLFTNRYTLEHVPAWAASPLSTGKYYAPQYRSDREWYENTEFPSDLKSDCISRQHTFPLGYYLDKPYTPGVFNSVESSGVPYEVEYGQIFHSN